jgi:HSP20 family molecular chaperone IbpA
MERGGVLMDDKIKVMPCTCFSHDDQGGRLRIDMEMPGVDKKDISLEMRKDSFCVSAPRGQDTEYSGCFTLALEIVPKKQRPSTKVAFSQSSHRSRTGTTE